MKRKAKGMDGGQAGELAYIAEDLRPLAVPIDELVADPRNARTHDAANVNAIAASLSRFGQVKPVVVNTRNGQIVAGNGTYAAAKKLGWTHLAAVRVEQSEAAQTGYAIADNRTAELAGWDELRLAELVGEIQDASPDLYDVLLLADLVHEEPDGGCPPDDYTPELGVFIECTDEAEQERWFAAVKKEGGKCRILTL